MQQDLYWKDKSIIDDAGKTVNNDEYVEDLMAADSSKTDNLRKI